MCIFRYLKQVQSSIIAIDSKPLDHNCAANYVRMIPDFSQDYPNACEELDDQLPQVFSSWLEITMMVDSDYAHDFKTHCSLTSLIPWNDSTTFIWFSQR